MAFLEIRDALREERRYKNGKIPIQLVDHSRANDSVSVTKLIGIFRRRLEGIAELEKRWNSSPEPLPGSQ